MSDNYRELYNIEKHRSAGLRGENTRLRKTNAALQEDLNQLNKLLASSIPVIWHDLTKNPDDLPEFDKRVLDERGHKVYWSSWDNIWYDIDENDDKIGQPSHWCEAPYLKN